MTRILRPLSLVAALALSAGAAGPHGRGDVLGTDRRGPPGLERTGGVPPGLAKKGGLPPGQARRANVVRVDDGVYALRDVFGRNGYTVVRTAPAGRSRYVYYRGADGGVRRAVVRPGAERLAFGNVPAAIASEVLARLY
jgi:hypothetical protein